MLEKADDNRMVQSAEEFAKLLHKYLKGELSLEDKKRLDDWVSQSPHNRRVFEEISNEDTLGKEIKKYYELLPQIEEIRKRHSAEQADVIRMFSKKTSHLRWVAAASIILVMAAGTYFFVTNRRTDSIVQTPAATHVDSSVIPPASNKAILTLANGSHIILDQVGKGVIAQQNNTSINKKQDGELVYDASNASAPAGEASYNIISTPRGGKYQLILPDGSKVWLNAASSLRFPIAFTGEERKVELKGEAYFEIAASVDPSHGGRKRPFIVSANETAVEVLGTHFNVNAYSDETQLRTTLLEGSVKITTPRSLAGAILKPGQQAIVNTAANKINVVTKDDPESAIAWMKGRFSLEKASIASLMRELSRWYDVQVVYEGPVSTNTMTGEVDRTIPLSELLANLEKMGDTRFKIEGRTVKVIAQ